jgi:hypothetical protein
VLTEYSLSDHRTESRDRKLLKIIDLVGAIGFEFWGRRSFNNIERAAGTVKQWKTVVSSANGSQTDHGPRVDRTFEPLRSGPPILDLEKFQTKATEIFTEPICVV